LEKKKRKRFKTYKIGERIQLLTHHAALFPPARYLAVQKIEKETKGQESEGQVQSGMGCELLSFGDGGCAGETVAQGGED